MNDTHAAEGQGWYGFGLDGTLAFYDRVFAEKEPCRVRMEKAHDALSDLLKDWPEEAR